MKSACFVCPIVNIIGFDYFIFCVLLNTFYTFMFI
jgi:hypothetical protein